MKLCPINKDRKRNNVNVDTGELYRMAATIKAAEQRGENLAPISEQAADRIEAGYAAMNRQQRRQYDRESRKQQKIKTSV